MNTRTAIRIGVRADAWKRSDVRITYALPGDFRRGVFEFLRRVLYFFASDYFQTPLIMRKQSDSHCWTENNINEASARGSRCVGLLSSPFPTLPASLCLLKIAITLLKI